MKSRYAKSVQVWLIFGCVLLFFQVVIGGVTRITGSGLSITKWDIVTGTLPPFSQDAWLSEFDLYKQTPQYHKINDGMLLSDFKFIYFWEYFHRLWARMMGFAFLFPALWFAFRKQIDASLWKKLAPVIGFAMLAAIFGWIMVASGLVNRPWVNAYKLSLHLGIAFTTFAFLVRATIHTFGYEQKNKQSVFVSAIGLFLGLQILLGGVMSGMKAGLTYPTWPDMKGTLLPKVLTNVNNWSIYNLEHYDTSLFAPALVQFSHRLTAYVLFALCCIFLIRALRNNYHFITKLFCAIIFTQVVVGVLTVINCDYEIPLFLGVLHQAVALLLVGCFVMVCYMHRSDEIKPI